MTTVKVLPNGYSEELYESALQSLINKLEKRHGQLISLSVSHAISSLPGRPWVYIAVFRK